MFVARWRTWALWLCVGSATALRLCGEAGASCAVGPDPWTPLPACALEMRGGQQFVQRGYVARFFRGDARAPLAPVILPQKDWAYIDRRGRVVVRHLAMMDNFPNDFHDGLVRVTENGKWGLADTQGNMTVPLRYDGMMDFAPGRGWEACTGCHEVGDEDGHHWFEGGAWVRLRRGPRGIAVDELPAPKKR